MIAIYGMNKWNVCYRLLSLSTFFLRSFHTDMTLQETGGDSLAFFRRRLKRIYIYISLHYLFDFSVHYSTPKNGVTTPDR